MHNFLLGFEETVVAVIWKQTLYKGYTMNVLYCNQNTEGIMAIKLQY